jgi:hypothetical protein
VEDADGRLGVRFGLGYIKGVVAAEVASMVQSFAAGRRR